MRPSLRAALVPAILLPLCAGCDTLPEEGQTVEEPARAAAVDEASGAEILVRGSRFRGTNGILFGPDGRLYVASVATPVIAALDPETGETLESYGPDDGVRGPDDLAFGPDGSLYWTDISFGDVGKRTPDGESSVIASLGPGVNPITFSDDGRLFVSQCFFGSQLWEVDPAGQDEPRLVSDELGPRCGLNGMDWGPDDRLYGPRWFDGSVVRVEVDSGAFETVAEDFGVPAAVKFDSQGRLHVLDSLRGEIVRVSPEDGSQEVVGRVQPSSADNLAFDSEDRLFVSSFGDGFIVEVTASGEVRTVVPGGLNMPGGLALVPGAERGLLFVADFFALRGLDPATGEEVHTSRDIIGFSELGSVMSVARAGDDLVLTSWFDNTVKLWEPSGERLVASFEDVARPVAAVAFQDALLVSEWGSGSVVRLDPEAPEDRTTLADGLEGPAGLSVSGGDAYVADRPSGKVLQILEDGEALSPPRPVAEALEGPEGLAIGPGGRLYVVEADAGRVTRISLDGGESETVAADLELHVPSQGDFPATMLFNGIAVGEERMFVTGDRANVIYTMPLPE